MVIGAAIINEIRYTGGGMGEGNQITRTDDEPILLRCDERHKRSLRGTINEPLRVSMPYLSYADDSMDSILK